MTSDEWPHRLRVVFVDNMTQSGEFDSARAMTSNEATLVAVTPTDDDRAVWLWMKQAGGGAWGEDAWYMQPRRFADFVIENYPQSGYALYAAPFLPMRSAYEPAPIFEELIDRFPERSFTEQLKLQVATYHSRASIVCSDVALATAESEEARRIASELIEKARSSNVRREAVDLLARTPTREQLETRERTQHDQ